MKQNQSILEACVETLEQAINAEKSGANRIELCGDLSVGGITPNFEMTQKAMENLNIPIMVMIRPRGGDFIYSESEIKQMKREIEAFKKLGVKGVVFGILDDKNEVNVDQTTELCNLAYPMEVTFHKAIDEVENPINELFKIMNINNLTRVLTSGKSNTAFNGAALIKDMINFTKGKLTILSAGKITNENLVEIHQLINGEEYHGRKIVGDLD